MVWEDNFDGTQLDTTKWKAETYFRRAAQNSAEAVTVKDGILALLTYTENGKNFTGFLSSKGKYETAFGYFESRIRFHTTPGEWGAFWVHTPSMGKPLGDPAKAGTEIDIMEHRSVDDKGKDISNMYVMNLHWDGYGKDHKHDGGKSKVPRTLRRCRTTGIPTPCSGPPKATPSIWMARNNGRAPRRSPTALSSST